MTSVKECIMNDDVKLIKLSEMVKQFTWGIRVFYSDLVSGQEFYKDVTGFAVKFDESDKKIGNDDLLLMTSAHALKQNNNIKVCRFGDKGFNFSATVVGFRPSWDIALLLVKGVNSNDIFGQFVDDNSIVNCQSLLHIGHLGNFVWSTFVGRAAYPCENDFVPLKGQKKCSNFDSTSLLTSSNQRRIMGHIYNEAYFCDKSKKFTYEKNLHPFVPIIQIAGFSVGDVCSGGPIVNMQGEIVGMLVGEVDHCLIAIHVTLLKEFMRISSIKDDDSSEGDKGKRQRVL